MEEQPHNPEQEGKADRAGVQVNQEEGAAAQALGKDTKSTIQPGPGAGALREEVQAQDDVGENEAQDLAKKAESDLSQEVYNNLMKEMANDCNSNTVSYENLSILLFMT